MKIKHQATETALLKALFLSICVVSVARAGLSYLPLTGPPALRLLAVRSPKPVPVTKIDDAAKLAATNAAGITPSADCTNAPEAVVNGSESGAKFLAGLPPINLGAGNPLDLPPGAPVFALPSQSMSSLTPEMVATYFQPIAVSTNGTVVAVPFHVGFIPPLADPDKSSHAEYIVK